MYGFWVNHHLENVDIQVLFYTYAVICPNNIVSVLCNNSYFGWRRID